MAGACQNSDDDQNLIRLRRRGQACLYYHSGVLAEGQTYTMYLPEKEAVHPDQTDKQVGRVADQALFSLITCLASATALYRRDLALFRFLSTGRRVSGNRFLPITRVQLSYKRYSFSLKTNMV